jgi:hypothetical protein
MARNVADEHTGSFRKPLDFLRHPRSRAVRVELIEQIARDGQDWHGMVLKWRYVN